MTELEKNAIPARNEVILVDEQDRPLGVEAKLRAHQEGGRLHRAFSVFIFDERGRMLLQRRSTKKYHFGGLWTNTCCSHPQRDEAVADSARARLREEFGFEVDLSQGFTFLYRATDPASGLTEHEFDHVFFGRFDGQPRPNPDEIDDWKWVEVEALMADVRDHPERYTPWFRIALEQVLRQRSETPQPARSE